jgi:hypothetical protein
MSARYERERTFVARCMPANTRYASQAGRNIWIFTKTTEVGIEFDIAVYYEPDEGGYCARLVSPEIENAWRNPHIGHIFDDGVICLGGASMRSRSRMEDAYAKSCVWAEGIALMLVSKRLGKPTAFPFSLNNDQGEVE